MSYRNSGTMLLLMQVGWFMPAQGFPSIKTLDTFVGVSLSIPAEALLLKMTFFKVSSEMVSAVA